uniref:Protein C10 n=1 Tax=Alexandrium monilatum TaxID=311494 RepID=A0A7S4S235_9DINO
MAAAVPEKAKEPPTLTRTQAIEIHNALIKAYTSPDFQQQLREAFEKAGKDERAQAASRQQLCFPIQAPVVTRYGFEPTRAGVFRCSRALETPEMMADPEVKKGNSILKWLVDPDSQKRFPSPEGYERFKPKEERVDEETGAGRYWTVTGGGRKGGIVVRIGQATTSAELARRLASGAVVQQLDLDHGRLHYKKIAGDGPDYGWVSLYSAGKPLLTCVDT